MAFYVFDLDGTLADASHRTPMLEQTPRPWAEFFGACVHDTPIDAMLVLLDDLWTLGSKVEIWTGRSDEVRRETEGWLDGLGVPPQILIRMRPAGDHRQDDELKRVWLNEARAAGRAPDMVFEDRARVVAMWRAEGVPCCQVAPGDF